MRGLLRYLRDEFATPFGRRRAQNWVFLGLMYGFFYMSRYNMSAVAPKICAVFGWNNKQYGSVLFAGTLVYGLSVFLNGPLADKIGGKRAILIGSAGAAFFNLLFGLMHLAVDQPAIVEHGKVLRPAVLNYGMTGPTVLATLAVLWGANHYFQSFGALSIVKINAAWFRVDERGTFAGIFGIMIQGGRWLAFAVSPFILRFLPWQWCFWIPAAILVLMWVANKFLVENSPDDAGLPPYDTKDETAEEAAQPATLSFILRKIFASPVAWQIAFASMCIGMVRNSVDHWWSKYMTSTFSIDPASLSTFAPYQLASWLMPALAITGGLVAGTASDRIFGARRAPVIFYAFVGQAVCLVLLAKLVHVAWAGAILLSAISFFIQSAHSLVGGAASMDFGGKKATATAAGLFDGAQYLAGAIVGPTLGALLDHYKNDYSIWPLAPLPFAFIGAILIARLWNAKPARGGTDATPTANADSRR